MNKKISHIVWALAISMGLVLVVLAIQGDSQNVVAEAETPESPVTLSAPAVTSAPSAGGAPVAMGLMFESARYCMYLDPTFDGRAVAPPSLTFFLVMSDFEDDGWVCWPIRYQPVNKAWNSAWYIVSRETPTGTIESGYAYSYMKLSPGDETVIWAGPGYSISGSGPSGPWQGSVSSSDGVEVTAVASDTMPGMVGVYAIHPTTGGVFTVTKPYSSKMFAGPYLQNMDFVHNGTYTSAVDSWVVFLDEPIDVTYELEKEFARVGEAVTLTMRVENIQSETLTETHISTQFCPEMMKPGNTKLVCIPDGTGRCDTTAWTEYFGTLGPGEIATATIQVRLFELNPGEIEAGEVHTICGTNAWWGEDPSAEWLTAKGPELTAAYNQWLAIIANNN